MATSAPVRLASIADERQPAARGVAGLAFELISFNAGTYATGGVNFTDLTDAPGTFEGMILLNDFDVANDRSYKWNGSISDPEVEVDVRATGVEVADTTDLSGYTLIALVLYQQ